MKKKVTRNASRETEERKAPHPPIARKWDSQYRKLCHLRDRLLKDRRELIADATYPVGIDGIHMADLGSDEFARDIDLSLLATEEDALFEVEEALRRIDRGTYGVCELTGEAIPMARLRAVPWARFSSDAESRLEHLGAIDKPHLGKLGRVETEPSSLSRELEQIQPPDERVVTPLLEKLAEQLESPGDEGSDDEKRMETQQE